MKYGQLLNKSTLAGRNSQFSHMCTWKIAKLGTTLSWKSFNLKNIIKKKWLQPFPGLKKLIEATESVAELSKELAVKEKELAVASKKADAVLAEVTVSAQAAEKVKAKVQVVKDKAQKIVDEISVDKAAATQQLEAARPALEEAERALQTIKPAHISTGEALFLWTCVILEMKVFRISRISGFWGISQILFFYFF